MLGGCARRDRGKRRTAAGIERGLLGGKQRDERCVRGLHDAGTARCALRRVEPWHMDLFVPSGNAVERVEHRYLDDRGAACRYRRREVREQNRLLKLLIPVRNLVGAGWPRNHGAGSSQCGDDAPGQEGSVSNHIISPS